jgi:hypothetical protein
MLATEYTEKLTGDMLLDIVLSQITLHGDKQLITKPELELSVELFVGGVNFLDCMDNDSMAEDNNKLSFLAARLKDVGEAKLNLVIETSTNFDEHFKVGFNSDEDGFIEVINSNEIKSTQEGATSFIIDTYQPVKHLPVHITHDGMELIENSIGVTKNNDSIFIEIGDSKHSTPKNIADFLDNYFPSLIEAAIEDNCEHILFYI